MRSLSIGALVAIAVIIGASFYVVTNFDSEIAQPSNSEESSNVGSIADFNDSVNGFAFDIYREMYNDPNNSGNIFISPYSIFTALAMTYEGARNITAEEMRNVLNIEQDNGSFHKYMQGLYSLFNKNNVSTANALWPKIGFHLLQSYVNTIETYYGGRVSEVDYSNPEKAADIINSWVENKTNNLIHDLVPPNAIDPDLTMLILTNAIYFKGIWKIQFDDDNTTDRLFTTSSGKKINVSTMCLTNTKNLFNYTETSKMQILELPYSDSNISMLIFLPKKGYTVVDVIDYLNKETFSNLIDSMSEKRVDIYLPKFEIKTPLYTLNDYLIDLGMPTAFSDNADFSGIDGAKDLYISKVLHKAFIEVNEEGTEAAAATAVIMPLKYGGGSSSSSRIIFDCNHPFIFVIYHKETNTILFMGNVNDPSE